MKNTTFEERSAESRLYESELKFRFRNLMPHFDVRKPSEKELINSFYGTIAFLIIVLTLALFLMYLLIISL